MSNHKNKSLIFGLMLAALCLSNVNSFIAPDRRIRTPINLPRKTTTSSTSLSMAFELHDISELYRLYPLQSAIATCGLKGSLADITAQIRSWTNSDDDDDDSDNENTIEMCRNSVQVVYGGLIGVLCHLMYDELYPLFFGFSKDFHTVIAEVLLDVFVVGPLVWLPPAYLIKAVFQNESLKSGVQNYLDDIRNEGLLWKYWAVWVPAEACTFGLVPDHLRVAFFAAVSFFWFIILSAVSFKDDKEGDELAATVDE